jgi:histidine phosphotransferase ChpT
MNEIDFGSLLCARLCHDLISPVSAARNGIAMVQDETDPAMRTDAMALTEDGLVDTIDKLKVYRIAYGVAGSGTTLAAARAAALGLFARGRVSIDWPEGGADPGPEAVRLLLNLVLLGADAVARGGTVRVVSSGPAPAIEATGGRAGFAPDVLSVLDGETPPDALTPRQIQAALTLRLAARERHTIAHTSTDGAVSLSANA